MKEKKNWTDPELEIISFASTDIIITSWSEDDGEETEGQPVRP